MMNLVKKNIIKSFPNTLKRCSSSVKWLEPYGYKTGLKVYNSTIKSKVELVTKRDKILSWYSCGPTVYDSAHIGHACCYMQYDIIRRIIEESGLNVVYVMGVTDIDDKIINKSNQLGVDFKTVSRKYEDEFFNDLKLLNIKMPHVKARVSNYIDSIVNFIQVIVDNGLGYVGSDGSVYFSVDKFQFYGKLVNLMEEKNEGNRDFVMWKKSKIGEPSWDSPWGHGRPGWHIECSAMASQILGQSIDIHTGGIDLKFPHHENEEAQCCAHHKINQWVNYWLHTGHLYISPEAKMSKSLQNTISIQDFLSEYSPNHLRMLCMMIPYRHPIEYNQEVIGNAVNLERKFVNFISDIEIYYTKNNQISIDESFLLKELEKTKNYVNDNLKDDFDTQSALMNINKLISATNSQLKKKSEIFESPSYSIIAISNFVNNFLQKLGFSYDKTSNNEILLKNIVESVLDFRTEVRKSALSIGKNESKDVLCTKTQLLKACDSLRDDLNKSGIELKDHGSHTAWNMEQPNIKKKQILK